MSDGQGPPETPPDTPPETPPDPHPRARLRHRRPTVRALPPARPIRTRSSASRRTRRDEDIRAAYDRFAQAPDLWLGTDPAREERLHRIEAAYRLLSDPDASRCLRPRARGRGVRVHDGRRGADVAEPGRPHDAQPPAPVADRDRLGRDDHRRDPDRARAQAVDRQPVPDPVLVDGADAALRAARARAARRTSPTACSRAASASTSAARRAATSSSSRRRRGGREKCGEGGTFVKRLIGLPGETVHGEGRLRLHRRQAAEGDVHPEEAVATRRPAEVDGPEGPVLLHGRQPPSVLRLAPVGLGAARQPDRHGLLRLLAAQSNRLPLAPWTGRRRFR